MALEGRPRKIVFGCLGGCGLVLLMTVGSCIGLTVWLNSPGEVLEPRILLGPETTGYLEWTLRLEDPGTGEFVEGMLTSFSDLNDRNDSPLPDGLEQLLNSRQINKARKDLDKLFPMVAAWTARPGEGLDEDDHLFSLSARGIGHQMIFLDWLLGPMLRWTEDVETVRYEGEKIYVIKEESGTRPSIFIHRGIVFATTDLDSARATRDRLKLAGNGSPVNTELTSLFNALPQDHALRGAVTNRRGELRRLLDLTILRTEDVEDAVWDDVRGATVEANFREENEFSGVLKLQGPDTEWARTNATRLGAALDQLFEGSKIEIVTEVRNVGASVHFEFSTSDLFEQIDAINP
jgi:hypothetical protein